LPLNLNLILQIFACDFIRFKLTLQNLNPLFYSTFGKFNLTFAMNLTFCNFDFAFKPQGKTPKAFLALLCLT